ncbi:MAG: hypothetical protein CR997_05920 [Acidobacteria bacterium]|nr:MAG: hypothetical protein CR997_05920 [Acidobacteriota bacterium]
MIRFHLVRNAVINLFARRWLASFILLVLLDTATFLALKEPSGRIQLFPHLDKVLHFLGFTVLTVMGFISLSFDWFSRLKRGHYLLHLPNVILWSGYGLGIEFLQSKLAYRQASMGDFAADMAGILLGTSIVHIAGLYFRQEQNDD